MNKSTLAIATILALGTVGCAGAVHQANTTPAPHAASAQYAGGDLGTLWESPSAQPEGLGVIVAADEVGSDLWNPAPVVGIWGSQPVKQDPKATFSTTATKLKF